jgi:transcriptional regulator NrdR family protein
MKCPICSIRTRVIDSRYRNNYVHRRHNCARCGRKYSTIEVFVPIGISPHRMGKWFNANRDAIHLLDDIKDQIAAANINLTHKE